MNRRYVAIISIVIAAGVTLGSLAWYSGIPGISSEESAVGGNQRLAQQPDEAGPPTAEKSTVTLTEGKRNAVSLEVSPVAVQSIVPYHTVPGRVQYDDRRHIEVRLATAGILARVLVKPGDRVEQGDVLAVLNSPEVGHARADVLQRETELRLAKEKLDWELASFRGLEELRAAILKRTPSEEIRKQFRTVSLGNSREKILTAYSQLNLSEQLVASASENVASGVVPRRTLQERQSELESAEASLLGSLEQLAFEARQASHQAQMAVEDVERRLRISRQTVSTLLGSTKTDETRTDETRQTAVEDTPASAEQGDVLSLVELTAPFAGTIERQNFSSNERVSPGESIFTLADTSTVWIAAELRDRDRGGLTLNPGDEVEVILPADAGPPMKARVHIIGREVDIQTNAVPLIAELPNPNGLLRPGMFVSVRVPMSQPRQALVIPESALAEHESLQFVFVPDGDATYRRVNITTGMRSGEKIEVVSGLKELDNVVVAGTFTLKSELLLESEE